MCFTWMSDRQAGRFSCSHDWWRMLGWGRCCCWRRRMKVMKTAGHSSAGCRGWGQSGVRAAASACLRLQPHQCPSAPGAQRGTLRCGPGSAPCGLSVTGGWTQQIIWLCLWATRAELKTSRTIRWNKSQQAIGSQFTSIPPGFCTFNLCCSLIITDAACDEADTIKLD